MQDITRIEKINKLIPLAVKNVNRQLKLKKDSHITSYAADNWSRAFVDEMDSLTIDAGLRVRASHRKIKAYRKTHRIEIPDHARKRA